MVISQALTSLFFVSCLHRGLALAERKHDKRTHSAQENAPFLCTDAHNTHNTSCKTWNAHVNRALCVSWPFTVIMSMEEHAMSRSGTLHGNCSSQQSDAPSFWFDTSSPSSSLCFFFVDALTCARRNFCRDGVICFDTESLGLLVERELKNTWTEHIKTVIRMKPRPTWQKRNKSCCITLPFPRQLFSHCFCSLHIAIRISFTCQCEKNHALISSPANACGRQGTSWKFLAVLGEILTIRTDLVDPHCARTRCAAAEYTQCCMSNVNCASGARVVHRRPRNKALCDGAIRVTSLKFVQPLRVHWLRVALRCLPRVNCTTVCDLFSSDQGQKRFLGEQCDFASTTNAREFPHTRAIVGIFWSRIAQKKTNSIASFIQDNYMISSIQGVCTCVCVGVSVCLICFVDTFWSVFLATFR